MNSFNRLYNIVISAVCMGLAQHPLGLGWLAWFCLVPLFISIKDTHRARNIFFDVFIWGFIYHLVSLYWLIDNIGVDDRYVAFITMILANLVCTVNIIFIFLTWHFINCLNRKKIWYSLPFIWVMIEYLSSLTQISFPWASIANTQAQESLLPMIQFVELTGMFGLTFWILCLNVSLFYIFLNKDKIRILESLGIFLLPVVLGVIITKSDLNDIDKIDFAMLQPNIHIDEKWENESMLLKHRNETDKYLDQINKLSNETLLIWPESAFTYNTSLSRYNPYYDTNLFFLTGVGEYDKKSHYNSIYYLSNNKKYLGEAEKYRKIKLVPGAEHVPFSDTFSFLGDIALSGNFSAGDEYINFRYKNSMFAAMVCIESTYSDLSRQFVNKGANFLVYVANDGWYIHPPEAQQHAKQTILRAIETRKPILRCGNTGITWVVSPNGSVLKELKHNTNGMLTSEGMDVYSNDTKTLFVIAGNWLSYASIFVVFCLILKGFIIRYRK